MLLVDDSSICSSGNIQNGKLIGLIIIESESADCAGFDDTVQFDFQIPLSSAVFLDFMLKCKVSFDWSKCLWLLNHFGLVWRSCFLEDIQLAILVARRPVLVIVAIGRL